MPTSTTIGALAALSIALYTLRQTSLRKRSIANEKILIVGASSGVGLELAKEHAARSDVSLHLVARRPLDALCKSLSTGSTASVRNSQVDVSVPTEVCRLVDEIGQAWSRIDTVIVWSVNRDFHLPSSADADFLYEALEPSLSSLFWW